MRFFEARPARISWKSVLQIWHQVIVGFPSIDIELVPLVLATLLVAVVAVAVTSPGRANPVIIELLKGVAYGVGSSAGKELYDSLRNHASTDTTRPKSQPSVSPDSGGLSGTAVPQPTADSSAFSMRIGNHSGTNISLQFYSLARRGREWPANGRAYSLPNDREDEVKLTCAPGEMICYGAWSEQKVWGVGYKFRQTCDRCCQFCGTPAAAVSLW